MAPRGDTTATGAQLRTSRHVFGFVMRTSTSVPSACFSRNVRVSPGFNLIKGTEHGKGGDDSRSARKPSEGNGDNENKTGNTKGD
jgi:hypothetical protein